MLNIFLRSTKLHGNIYSRKTFCCRLHCPSEFWSQSSSLLIASSQNFTKNIEPRIKFFAELFHAAPQTQNSRSSFIHFNMETPEMSERRSLQSLNLNIAFDRNSSQRAESYVKVKRLCWPQKRGKEGKKKKENMEKSEFISFYFKKLFKSKAIDPKLIIVLLCKCMEFKFQFEIWLKTNLC